MTEPIDGLIEQSLVRRYLSDPDSRTITLLIDEVESLRIQLTAVTESLKIADSDNARLRARKQFYVRCPHCEGWLDIQYPGQTEHQVRVERT